MDMNKIKFYSEYDLTCGLSIENIIKSINTFENKTNLQINEIIEYFNILKFNDIKRYSEIINVETSNKFNNVINVLNDAIGQFVGKYKYNFLSLYKEVESQYKEDFWEIVEKYNIYINFEEIDFEKFLKEKDFHYLLILKHKRIVNHFDEILRLQMLKDIKCAEFLLNKYMNDDTKKYGIFLPKTLSDDDKNNILTRYIESDVVHPNYLKKIIYFPNNNELKINDKIKLKAKRRYEEEMKKFFDRNQGVKGVVEVKYSENQEGTIVYNNEDMVVECAISLNWIKENLDFNTLLNNFIYIFEFFDMQMRLNLVSKYSEIGVLENLFSIENSKHLYKKSWVFNKKDMISTLQIDSYIQVLQAYDIRLENVIEWFFNSYLLEEFNVNSYVVTMPTNNSSYFEKCRFILPEIDAILKQYQIYVEDGEIDQELLQISSSHMFFKNCISTVDNKYVYPCSDLFHIASTLLFSDQSIICYLPHIEGMYQNFYQLIENENVSLSNFEKYQIQSIEWLIEKNFIYTNENGDLKFLNKYRIAVFYELYKHNVISYWHCDNASRKEIDSLIGQNILKFDNKLFTNDEQDYLDYHLNKAKFSNSLDLRNSYLHGTQINNDDLYRLNYVIFLKLIIIIITKINDDLCIKDIKNRYTN